MSHPSPPLSAAIATILPGQWAVGVSGGADSVALLSLLRTRSDLRLHVVHLDHETRGAASTADAEFVRLLADRWSIPCTIARRSDLEPRQATLPANPSARYRALRLALFREVVASHQLAGVVLAHHADDQAETILSRLLRGSGYAGLGGMRERTTVGGLLILRPLLAARREALREYLWQAGLAWREDASNASGAYQRNRLRRVLSSQPRLTEDLLELARSCRALGDWVERAAPVLEAAFPVERLAGLPGIVRRASARRWLLAQGCPPRALEQTPAAVDRLIDMTVDAASAPKQSFPGGVLAKRKRGIISAESSSGSPPLK